MHHHSLHHLQVATPHLCSFKLEIAQQPVHARASGWGSRSHTRRPVDPPPVVNLSVFKDSVDVNSFILQATLHAACPLGPSYSSQIPPQTSNLAGTTITSLNFMKYPPPGRAYFLFPDLSVRQEGAYRLVFSVFEICEHLGAIWRAEVVSEVLTVYSPKKFPGLDVSSALTREIASQGGKVRIRREARVRSRPKPSQKPSLRNHDEPEQDAHDSERARMSPPYLPQRSVSDNQPGPSPPSPPSYFQLPYSANSSAPPLLPNSSVPRQMAYMPVQQYRYDVQPRYPYTDALFPQQSGSTAVPRTILDLQADEKVQQYVPIVIGTAEYEDMNLPAQMVLAHEQENLHLQADIHSEQLIQSRATNNARHYVYDEGYEV